jgi:hypothetical protein
MVFDNVPEFVGTNLSQDTDPVFPGSKSFSVVVPGGNIAAFGDRWNKWIDPPAPLVGLWLQWRAYVEKYYPGT